MDKIEIAIEDLSGGYSFLQVFRVDWIHKIEHVLHQQKDHVGDENFFDMDHHDSFDFDAHLEEFIVDKYG